MLISILTFFLYRLYILLFFCFITLLNSIWPLHKVVHSILLKLQMTNKLLLNYVCCKSSVLELDGHIIESVRAEEKLQIITIKTNCNVFSMLFYKNCFYTNYKYLTVAKPSWAASESLKEWLQKSGML